MNKTSKIYIEVYDFQEYILNYIQSEDIKKIFNSTIFSTDIEKSELCFKAMQYGLILASFLTSQLPKFYVEEEK